MSANETNDLAVKYGLSQAQAEELNRLLTDMRPLGFTHSKHLSAYIVEHNLGYSYPEISGILTMRASGAEWPFEGGFPTRIYAIVCAELGLDNQKTEARVVGFQSFRDIKNARDATDLFVDEFPC